MASQRWKSLLSGNSLAGWQPNDPAVWFRGGQTLAAITAGRCEYTALEYARGVWTDLEFNVQATLAHGGCLTIHFAISKKHPTVYKLTWLRPMEKIAIASHQQGKRGTTVHHEVLMPLELEREYDITLTVHGSSVKSFVDGSLVNDVTVDGDLSGTINLSTYGEDAVGLFRSPRIKAMPQKRLR